MLKIQWTNSVCITLLADDCRFSGRYPITTMHTTQHWYLADIVHISSTTMSYHPELQESDANISHDYSWTITMNRIALSYILLEDIGRRISVSSPNHLILYSHYAYYLLSKWDCFGWFWAVCLFVCKHNSLNFSLHRLESRMRPVSTPHNGQHWWN